MDNLTVTEHPARLGKAVSAQSETLFSCIETWGAHLEKLPVGSTKTERDTFFRTVH